MNMLLVAAALIAGSLSPGVLQVASADISGAWELSVTTSRGVESATLMLKKNGDAFSGTAARGTEQALVEAKVKDKAVTILITAQTQNGPVIFTLTGEIAGDTMSGTGEFGVRGSGQWSAKRAAAAATADVSGTWAVEVATGQGTGTPAFTFKQDGDKLSGQYRGLFGEAPVTGTVKGSAIEFSVEVSVEGNGVRVIYSGTVEKDTMKGTVKFGDMGEGTFTGTRKREAGPTPASR
jgi:hypothetical protein